MLTPQERRRLVQAVFWAGTRAQLRAVEAEIARDYAATPEQRTANAQELQWLRDVVRARRETVGRNESASAPPKSSRNPLSNASSG